MTEGDPRRDLPPIPPPEMTDQDLARLWGAVEGESHRRAGWLRDLPTRRRIPLVVATMAAIAVTSTIVQGLRPDLTPDLVVRLGLQLGAAGVLAMLVVSVALRPLHRPPIGQPAMALTAFPLLPVIAALSPVWPGVDMGFWEAMPIHVHCLIWSTATSLAAALPFVLADRTGLFRRWSTLAGAGAAGTLGFVVQMANCPLISPEHKGIAHAFGGVTVGVGLMLIAAWRRW